MNPSKDENRGTVGTRAVDWNTYKTEEGREYYYNVVTRKTQWEKPRVLIEKEYRSSTECHWKEYETSDGNKYYHHELSKETQWEKPMELVKFEEEQKRQNSYKLTQKINKDSFMQLLEETVANSDWTWQDTMKKIIYDPRYKLIVSIDEKKKLFREFLDNKRLLERRNRKKQIEKKKQDFYNVLKALKDPVVSLSTRYSDIVDKIDDTNAYIALETDDARLECFHDYIQEMERKDKMNQQEVRKRRMEEFQNLLGIKYKQGFIKPTSLWRDVRKQVEHTKEVKQLQPFDVLKTWNQFIRKLEREAKLEELRQKGTQVNQERANRMHFWKLLSDLQRQNIISVDSEWKDDVREKVKVTVQYKAVKKQGGPTPKDMFFEFIDDLEVKYQKEKLVVKEILKRNKVQVGLQMTFEEFVNSIKDDQQFKNTFNSVNDLGNIRTYFVHSQKRKKKKSVKKFKEIVKDFDREEKYSNYSQMKQQLEKVNPKISELGLLEEEKSKYFDKIVEKREKKRAKKRSRDPDMKYEDERQYKRQKVENREEEPPRGMENSDADRYSSKLDEIRSLKRDKPHGRY